MHKIKNLILNRTYLEDCTIGHLFIKGQSDPLWHTIECPWQENEKNISCIPKGTYQVEPYSSAKFPNVWEVKNVIGRTLILIHVANFAHQLDGCIAVGEGAGYLYSSKKEKHVKAVTNSTLAIKAMREVLEYPSSFTLTIKGCPCI